ncbi:MAG: hypothetical protein QXK37_00395 [Candidatus Woesearchaeota archaeon]
MRLAYNNIVGVLVIMLLLLSILGPYAVYKRATEVLRYPTVTGKASSIGSIGIHIVLPPPDMNSLNLTAVLAEDNKSIILLWNSVSANNYSIYITDDIVSGFDYANPNITGLTATNWTDVNASQAQQRYYKVGVWNSGLEYVSNETAGKYDIEIKFANGNPAGYELNQISLPLMPANLSFSNIVRGGSDGDMVLRFNRTDLGPNFVGWETNIKIGGTWMGDFDVFSLLEGYVFINVQTPYNLTIAGRVPSEEVAISMPAVTGSPAGHEMILLGWNSAYPNCNLSNALNTTTPPETIVWFNTTNIGGQYDGWQTFMLIGSQWFPTSGCMLPGKGYRFVQIGTPYTWHYDRG